MKRILLAAALAGSSAAAHELTPTYPELVPSYIDGVSVTKMNMWNRRNDVSYYEIGVYDVDFNPLPFAAPERIFYIGYLERKTLEIYIRDSDIERVEYICTSSKQLKEDVKSTGIKSMICSRVK
jgi:hypothetical protein